MTWTLLRAAFGAVTATFSAMLLGLPLWRVMQGALPLRRAVGLWIGGGGFGCLAVAAFTADSETAQKLVVLGVVAVTAGTLIQRAMDGRKEEE